MRNNLRALVIDDDAQVRGLLAVTLKQVGWEVSEAATAEGALQLLGEGKCWPLVFCDVVLGKGSGYTVLRSFGQIQPEAHVIIMTGHGSAVGALEATALGAQDYLLKPFSIADVQSHADLVRARLSARLALPHTAGDEREVFTSDIDLVGSSPNFVTTMKMVGRIAATNLPVLITGESGTGKEVVARAIHLRSQRAARSFVAINCGALSAELIESELFGHVRGSFTGADRERVGLWEEANGGTIFLDEITETSVSFQVKLLRALQEGEVRRVGSNRPVRVDARVVAATNRDVEREVAEGRFRQDLHFRLNVVTIHLPPLRERREDIMPLAKRFAVRYKLPESPPVSFLGETVRLLESYHWPGNVRELEHTVMRAVALCDHTIRPEDLPERIRRPAQASQDTNNEVTSGAGENCILAIDDWWSLDELEGRYVARALEHTGGNKLAAARLLNVNRKTLDRMIKRRQVNVQTHARARSEDAAGQVG